MHAYTSVNAAQLFFWLLFLVIFFFGCSAPQHTWHARLHTYMKMHDNPCITKHHFASCITKHHFRHKTDINDLPSVLAWMGGARSERLYRPSSNTTTVPHTTPSAACAAIWSGRSSLAISPPERDISPPSPLPPIPTPPLANGIRYRAMAAKHADADPYARSCLTQT